MNSARSLAALLDSWKVQAGRTPASMRADGDVTSQAFWAEHRRVLDWLADIEGALNALTALGKDVSAFRASVPHWYAAVFAARAPMMLAKATPDELLDDSQLNMLSAFASLLDVVNWEPEFADNQANVFEALVHAEDLIRRDDGLDDATKGYLLHLLEEVRFVLSHAQARGGAAVRRAVMELGGALTTVSATSKDPLLQTSYLKVAVEIIRATGIALATKAVEGAADIFQQLTD